MNKPKKAAKKAEPKVTKPVEKKPEPPTAAAPKVNGNAGTGKPAVAAKKAKGAAKNGDRVVKAGAETTGPFRSQIWAMAKAPITVKALIEKATAAKIPTAAWKIGAMIRLGQLVEV